MGWKSTLRAIEAAERRAQREAHRRYRELQRRAKEQAKLSALEQARLEVETYENRLEVLVSIHKEKGQEWNWREILDSPPPVEPIRSDCHVAAVVSRRAAYRPGFFAKLFGQAKKKAEAFEVEMYIARGADDREFQDAQTQHERDISAWEDERLLAKNVVAGDRDAYARVLRELAPFAELSELGSSLSFRIHTPKLLDVAVKVNGQKAIPEEAKSLTASGKVSSKPIPKARFHEIYQDYVCGSVLRIGREIFALLPVETAIVTALADLFDSRTGRTSEEPILSVAFPRAVMNSLNFDRLDPSDAMENFPHRGDFKASRKSGAFVPITPLTQADLEAPKMHGVPLRPTPAVTVPSVAPSVNPFAAKWAEALRRNEIESGFLRLIANDLAELLGKARQDNFTLPESKALARAVENFGYCLEPDPRHGAGSFWGIREVGIFQPASGTIQEPTGDFLGASALLQLCVLVAAADGTVDRDELEQFRKFIQSQFHFAPDEHQRLVVLETLLGRDAASAKVTLSRTAKRVPQDKQSVIAQFLVDVAAADGVISPKEYKALTRIFQALGLTTDILDTFIQNLPTTGHEVEIQSGGTRTSGEAIPPRQPSGHPAALTLDMARVAAISAETHEVIGLLAKAMAEPEQNGEPEPPQVPRISSVSKPTVTESPSSSAAEEIGTNIPSVILETLDAKFHSIAQRLTSCETWSRTEFEALAQEHQLLPLSVFDAINEWADESLGDFLLEGEDPITVRRSILKS